MEPFACLSQVACSAYRGPAQHLAPGTGLLKLTLMPIPEAEAMRPLLVITACLAAVACDGPQEDAGEQADFANGIVNSQDTLRSGPAEDLGETQDRAAAAAEKSRDARADALEAEADEARQRAKHQARELDRRAEQIRSQ
jgi:hypothetical protein